MSYTLSLLILSLFPSPGGADRKVCEPHQDPDSIRGEIATLLEKTYWQLDIAKRNSVAERLTSGILECKNFGHDPMDVLPFVHMKLLEGLGFVSDVEAYGAALSKGLNLDPHTAKQLVLPESFTIGERERNIDLVDAWVYEIFQAPAPSKGETQEIARQIALISEELAHTLRTKLHGGYRDQLIEKFLSPIEHSLIGSIGDPWSGGVSRPLTNAEIQAVLRGIKTEGDALTPVDASSEAEKEFIKSGIVDLGTETDAMRAVSKMTRWMYSIIEANYPNTVAAENALFQVSKDAKAWMDKRVEPIREQLGKEYEEFQEKLNAVALPPRARTYIPQGKKSALPKEVRKESDDVSPDHTTLRELAHSWRWWCFTGVVLVAGGIVWWRSRVRRAAH